MNLTDPRFFSLLVDNGRDSWNNVTDAFHDKWLRAALLGSYLTTDRQGASGLTDHAKKSSSRLEYGRINVVERDRLKTSSLGDNGWRLMMTVWRWFDAE